MREENEAVEKGLSLGKEIGTYIGVAFNMAMWILFYFLGEKGMLAEFCVLAFVLVLLREVFRPMIKAKIRSFALSNMPSREFKKRMEDEFNQIDKES